MEPAAHQPTNPEPKPERNRWLRLGRRVLIGALIVYGVNFFLKMTGWDTWEKFSKQADQFSENIMDGAIRLSPISLWNSFTTDEYNYEYERGRYFDTRHATSKVTLVEKAKRWLSAYWYTGSGNAFWLGRILLIIAMLFGVGEASEEYQKNNDKTTALLVFPFIVLLKSILFLLGASFVFLVLYFIIKLVIAIGGGIVIIISGIHAGGGFIKTLFDEAKEEAAGESKKTLAGWMLPVFFRKRK